MPLLLPNMPPRSTPSETTAQMVEAIGGELAEIVLGLSRSRGDRQAEPRLTGIWMAYPLISPRALLQKMLLDTARRPRGITRPQP